MAGWTKPAKPASEPPAKKGGYREMQRETERRIMKGEPFGMKLLGKPGKAAAKRYGDGKKVIEKGAR